MIIQRLKDGDDIRDIEEIAQTLKRIDSGKDFVSSEADMFEKLSGI